MPNITTSKSNHIQLHSQRETLMLFPSQFSYFHILFCIYVTFYRLGVQPRETPGKSYILELQVLEAYRVFLTGPSHSRKFYELEMED